MRFILIILGALLLAGCADVRGNYLRTTGPAPLQVQPAPEFLPEVLLTLPSLTPGHEELDCSKAPPAAPPPTAPPSAPAAGLPETPDLFGFLEIPSHAHDPALQESILIPDGRYVGNKAIPEGEKAWTELFLPFFVRSGETELEAAIALPLNFIPPRPQQGASSSATYSKPQPE
jgi:hypothetical protein